MEHTAVEAHQEYIQQAEADHRHAKAVIQDLRRRGRITEADEAQREYSRIIELNFLRAVYGLYCEHRSTLRPPVLKKGCPACQGEV